MALGLELSRALDLLELQRRGGDGGRQLPARATSGVADPVYGLKAE
jgi:hypothetical protein